ncbi:MAG: 4'-phosphopantetheinyl transferase family protein [Nocardioides sp.]|uniref:4'-phosphopantetheinyl transferase family protein n=1 Tax=Nocardioides sp. TaxID=35761 RepID=UPI003F0B880D
MTSPTTAVVLFRTVEAVEGADPGRLSSAELARWQRLRDAGDRRAFLAAHWLVRECAADALRCAAGDLDIELGCPGCGSAGHGPPRVVGAPGLGLSLSHTRTHVAAVAAPGACGVDVETSGSAVPVRALAAAEQAWVEAGAGAHDATRLWVRKEALVKAGVATLEAPARLVVVDGDGPLNRYEAPLGVLELGEWGDDVAVGAWAVAGEPVARAG